MVRIKIWSATRGVSMPKTKDELVDSLDWEWYDEIECEQFDVNELTSTVMLTNGSGSRLTCEHWAESEEFKFALRFYSLNNVSALNIELE